VRIALNLAADHRRSRRASFWKRLFGHSVPGRDGAARPEASEAIESVADGRTGAEQALIASEEVAAMWRAVAELPPRQRAVFVLRFVEEMKLEEIGQALGLSLASVKTHLHRGTLAVRQHLQSKEGCRS
jgi:RNA polymerase sigma-70 factor (ECF subfamily)